MSCETLYLQGFSPVTAIYQNLSLFVAVHKFEANFIFKFYQIQEREMLTQGLS